MKKIQKRLAAGFLAAVLTASFLAAGMQQLYAGNGVTDTPSFGSFTWHKKDLLTTGEQNKIMTQCAALKGRPYKLGTRGPSTFDCTGFVWYVMRNCGVSDLKNAMNEGVWTTAKWYAKFHGKECDQGTSLAKATKGDIIIYGNSAGTPHHAAIYAGKENGKYMVWHAGVTLGVCKVSNDAITGSSGKGKLKIIGIYRTTEDTGKLQMKKSVDFGSKSGFSFKVSCSSLGWSKTYKTDSTGIVTLTGLPIGYTFKVEEGSRSGYIAVKSQSAKIASGTKKLTFQNRHTTGSLKITKAVTGTDLKDKSGFRFRVYRTAAPAYDKTYTTDANGRIQISGLYAGYSYTIEEKMSEAQSAVYQGPAPKKITIVKDKVTAVTMTNSCLGSSLVIQKTFDDATIPPKDLSGFSFTVSEKSTGYKKTLSTDKTGKTGQFDGLKVGITYTVTENLTEEQKKLYQGISEKTVTIDKEYAGKTMTFHMENHAEQGNLELLKQCSGAPKENGLEHLSGFLFSFTNVETGMVTQATTDQEGRIYLEGLQAGTYEVQEILGSEASKWKPEEETKTVEVKKNETTSFVFSNVWRTGTLKLVKTAEDGIVEGIAFTVTGPDGYEETVVTEADGTVDIPGLQVGTYQIVENVSEQYEPQPAKSIELKADTVNEVSFYNERKRGGLRICKVDADTEQQIEQEGFEFLIENLDTDEEWTEKTDSFGLITLHDIGAGEYRITETAVPEDSGYLLNDEPHTVVVEDGAEELTDVIVKDERQKGRLEIQKTGDVLTDFHETEEEGFAVMYPAYTAEGLSGAVFDIIAEEDIYVCGMLSLAKGEVAQSVQTNQDGMAYADLELGTYRIRETMSPKGYVNTKKEYVVTLANTNSHESVITEKLQVENSYQTVRLDLKKQMEISEEYGYGKHGEAEQVIFGIFNGEEIEAADGKKLENDTLIAIMKPKKNGEAIYEGMLPFGDYYVRELQTAPGYCLDQTKYSFSVSAVADGEQTIHINGGEAIENQIQSTTIRGIKLDADTDKPLAGGVFGLFRDELEDYTEKTALAVAVTDEKGTFQFAPVVCGKYWLAELTAPDGYLPLAEPMEVEVTEDSEEQLVFTIKNEPIPSDFVLTKKDAVTGEVLPGAEFCIYGDDKKTLVAEGETNEQGEVSFTLRPGNYYYQEYEAPKGYYRDETLYPFTISWTDNRKGIVEKGKTVTAERTNERKTGSISVYKSDAESGELLTGAKFRLLDEKGNFLKEAITSEGAVYFDQLPYGTYILEEAEAPEGYRTAKSETVTVDQPEEIAVYIKDEKVSEVLAENQDQKLKKTNAVKTGDSTEIFIWIVLTLLAAGGITVGIWRISKH